MLANKKIKDTTVLKLLDEIEYHYFTLYVNSIALPQRKRSALPIERFSQIR